MGTWGGGADRRACTEGIEAGVTSIVPSTLLLVGQLYSDVTIVLHTLTVKASVDLNSGLAWCCGVYTLSVPARPCCGIVFQKACKHIQAPTRPA